MFRDSAMKVTYDYFEIIKDDRKWNWIDKDQLLERENENESRNDSRFDNLKKLMRKENKL